MTLAVAFVTFHPKAVVFLHEWALTLKEFGK